MSDSKFDFVTLGESMLRFSPPGMNRIENSQQFDIMLAGTESNVAINLARMGKQCAWISRLPENPLGKQVGNTIRQYGVDITGVKWVQNERQAIYFVEYGSAPRPIRVWYDRANSAASKMTPDDVSAEMIQSARWLHLTGITPALSENCKDTVVHAIAIAREAGLKISFDVNYRALLWSPEDAANAIEPFCKAADMVFVAGRDAENLFGVHGDDLCKQLHDRWGGLIVTSHGTSGIECYDGQSVVRSDAYEVEVVDRVGAGDAMAAGIICRLLEDASLQEALEFGSALAAIKLTIPGDLALTSRAEVEELLANRGATLQR